MPTPILDDMVLIPGGAYTFTQPERDPFDYPSSPHRKPRIEVQLRPFLIDRREVSQGEYAAFAAATGAPLPSYFIDDTLPAGHDDRPVHGLTYTMAASYAAWVGKELPTEAQWEAAARSRLSRLFPWGNDEEPSSSLEVGRWDDEAQVWRAPDRLAPISALNDDRTDAGVRALVSGPPEWTSDSYAGSPFAASAAGDVPPGARVLRGMWLRHPSTWNRLRAMPDRPAGGLRCVVEIR